MSKHVSRLQTFVFRHLVPGLAFLGAGTAALGTLYSAAVVVLIGGLTVGITTLVAHVRQSESESSLKDANAKILCLTEELRAKAEEGLNTHTGGDSFCFLTVDADGRAVILHTGKYPLYDVSWYAYDLQSAKHIPLPDIGNISPNKAYTPAVIKPHYDELKWNVFFSGRNGFWSQQLRCRRIDGVLHTSYTVKWNDEGRALGPIAEHIDSLVPLDPE